MKQRITTTIYVGGPDRDRVCRAIHVLAENQYGLHSRVSNPQVKNGRKKAIDDPGNPATVQLSCDRSKARRIASEARKLAKNADAHCRVVEDPVA